MNKLQSKYSGVNYHISNNDFLSPEVIDELYLTGDDCLARLGIANLISEIICDYKVQINDLALTLRPLSIRVFSGLCLLDVYKWHIENNAYTTQNCFIIVCSQQCRRLLFGLRGYESAKFIDSCMSIKQIRKKILLMFTQKHTDPHFLPLVLQPDFLTGNTVNGIINGWTAEYEALKANVSKKSVYQRRFSFSQKIKIRNRSELYVKTLLLLLIHGNFPALLPTP